MGPVGLWDHQGAPWHQREEVILAKTNSPCVQLVPCVIFSLTLMSLMRYTQRPGFEPTSVELYRPLLKKAPSTEHLRRGKRRNLIIVPESKVFLQVTTSVRPLFADLEEEEERTLKTIGCNFLLNFRFFAFASSFDVLQKNPKVLKTLQHNSTH